MPFERFGYLVLEQREMVCQHVVKKSRDSHLVASDYMKHLLDAVVVFLADIDLLAEPCRCHNPAFPACRSCACVLVPLWGAGQARGRFPAPFLSEVGKARFRPCFSLPAECLYRPVETS